MGVIAFNPMLKAGTSVSSRRRDHGRRNARHPDPPSVMIIVYAAVTGQSVSLRGRGVSRLLSRSSIRVTSSAGATTQRLRQLPSETRVPVRPWVAALSGACKRGYFRCAIRRIAPAAALKLEVDGASLRTLVASLGHALVPLALVAATFGATWCTWSSANPMRLAIEVEAAAVGRRNAGAPRRRRKAAKKTPGIGRWRRRRDAPAKRLRPKRCNRWEASTPEPGDRCARRFGTGAGFTFLWTVAAFALPSSTTLDHGGRAAQVLRLGF
jgi:hypothetical protein